MFKHNFKVGDRVKFAISLDDGKTKKGMSGTIVRAYRDRPLALPFLPNVPVYDIKMTNSSRLLRGIFERIMGRRIIQHI